MSTPSEESQSDLLSDEPTIELVVRAQAGDRHAVEAILQRSVPHLKRWAHGRLPSAARNNLDTGDLVQDTVLHVLRRIDRIQFPHVGSMQAYLRKSVLNRIRDEVRRIGRHPSSIELPMEMPSEEPWPDEQAIKMEAVSRYYEGLATLTQRDRELIVSRIEAEWSYAEIAGHFTLNTPDAARMAVKRALERLLAATASKHGRTP